MSKNCVFFRAVLDDNKMDVLSQRCAELKNGNLAKNVFYFNLASIRRISGSPFTYWVSSGIIDKISNFPELEDAGALVKVGMQTGDDFRFLRSFWEVSPQKVKQRKWVYYTKTDSAIPWYSPITLVVNWSDDGFEIRNLVDSKGKVRSAIRSPELYGRPGFSYMLRSTRLVPYIVPRDCIPTAGRSQVFPHRELEVDALLLCSSNFGSAIARFRGEKFGWPKFQAGMVQSIPFKKLSQPSREYFKEIIFEKIQNARNNASFDELSLEFVKFDQLAIQITNENNFSTFLGRSNEELFAREFGLSSSELAVLEHDLQEAVSLRADQSNDDDISTPSVENIVGPSAFVSYAVGCILGRWDIRYATGERQPPELPDPFAPLPACSPGMLQGEDGLPLDPHEIPSGYPLVVDPDGILVDDEGHPDDIIARIRDVLILIWGKQADTIEKEACEILGVKTLRDYFRKPGKGGFWDDHLKRYSKSRRKAPIYWLLQSAKKNYGIWIYYPRMDGDALYKALRYAKDKLAMEGRRLDGLQKEREQSGTGGAAVKRLEKEIEGKEALVSELHDFVEKLERAANLDLIPEHDDGVVLTIAPLRELVPWNEPGKYWDELIKGKYAWSSIGKQLAEKGLVTRS